MASISTGAGDTFATTPVTARTAPPLAAGDRLTADEFLRRYHAMPEITHAELVEGVAYIPSPVSAMDHGEPHFRLNGVLFNYQAQTPGVVGGDNSTLKLDVDNVPQPDGYLRIVEKAGGRAVLQEGYVVGGPELIAEVAASSASYDLHDKLNAYRRNGVREYIVWRVWDQAIDWFILHERRFERLHPGDDGVYRSQVLPGLWLDANAVIAGDLARALAVLQTGLADPAHRTFVAELKHKLEA
jgi:Uma2 family endonuclease